MLNLMCPGNDIADKMLRVMLSQLVFYWEIVPTVNQSFEEVEYEQMSSIRPKDVHVKFVPIRATTNGH